MSWIKSFIFHSYLGIYKLCISRPCSAKNKISNVVSRIINAICIIAQLWPYVISMCVSLINFGMWLYSNIYSHSFSHSPRYFWFWLIWKAPIQPGEQEIRSIVLSYIYPTSFLKIKGNISFCKIYIFIMYRILTSRLKSICLI